MASRAEQRERRTKRKLDGVGTSRKNPTPSSSSSSSTQSGKEDERDPWPREKGKEIPLYRRFPNPRRTAKSRECLHRPVSDTWDAYDSLFYNEWLKVAIEPTRFIDSDILRILGIDGSIGEMITQLGLGTIATRPYDLHPSLVRQFMATVRFEYKNQPSSVAGDGVLSFFARGIRYYVSVPELCEIYGFDDHTATSSNLSVFPTVKEFWEIIATGHYSSATLLQADIRHPALRYFMRIIASTLLCKMEPNKVRIHELTVLYHAVDGLVDLTFLDPEREMLAPNLGAVFAEHLLSLKMKPFSGTSGKTERVGSLLTPIFQHLGIRLDETDVNTSRAYLDAAHLRSSSWLNRQLHWTFRTPEGPRVITLPHRATTDFASDIDRIRFQPDPRLVRNPPAPRRVTGPRSDSTSPATPGPLPPFPDLSGMETGEERVFRRGVMDALQAIWSRVSRCRCSSRASTSAFDPSAAGPSHQTGQDEGDEAGDDDEGNED